MLRVTVEIVPFGDEERKRTLGSMTIINDMTGDLKSGNYSCEITSYDWTRNKDVTVKVKGHPRMLGFWKLLHTALGTFLKKYSITERELRELF